VNTLLDQTLKPGRDPAGGQLGFPHHPYMPTARGSQSNGRHQPCRWVPWHQM